MQYDFYKNIKCKIIFKIKKKAETIKYTIVPYLTPLEVNPKIKINIILSKPTITPATPVPVNNKGI